MEISNFQVVAEGNKARRRMAQLMAVRHSRTQYLDSEMARALVKIDFRPDFKAVLQAMAEDEREAMSDFVITATRERIERILNAKIIALEALDAPLAMSLVGPDDADVLAVKVA